MTHSFLHRFTAVLVALLFGLGWGASLGHASCTPMGSSSPDRCDTSIPVSHCEGDMESSSAVCHVHHASQEALTAASPSPDLQDGSSASSEERAVDSSLQETDSLLSFVRDVVPHVQSRHALVGVWLE